MFAFHYSFKAIVMRMRSFFTGKIFDRRDALFILTSQIQAGDDFKVRT
ncbi:hypothetical protein S1OALGB6SA_2015 [Olavius algarvensis spirochete endosymbiont]|nr:hypothetical protein S1OALGB6SA_2015 [Olavius algarvensis spirochete endosymbiont]